MNRCFRLLCCLCSLVAAAGCAGRRTAQNGLETAAEEKAGVAVQDRTRLPRVLLIGDSISNGYMPAVVQLLQGKAQVEYPPVNNCESTIEGLRGIDKWLGSKPWDVIHFNFGLHDIKYIDSEGKKTDVSKGTQKVSIEQYEKNLRELVIRLKKTGAKLIFATTTPVPEGARGRVKGDEVRYNKVAVEIMKEHGIPVNDLYSLAMQTLDQIQGPRNVHFTNPDGYEVLAGQVTAHILKALDESEMTKRQP